MTDLREPDDVAALPDGVPGDITGTGVDGDTTVAIVACADLMTASRISDPDITVVHARTQAKAMDLLSEHPEAIVVIDLQGFPGLPRTLRESGVEQGRIIAFAPHVQVEVMEYARAHAGRVVPRGSIVQRFGVLVRSAAAG